MCAVWLVTHESIAHVSHEPHLFLSRTHRCKNNSPQLHDVVLDLIKVNILKWSNLNFKFLIVQSRDRGLRPEFKDQIFCECFCNGFVCDLRFPRRPWPNELNKREFKCLKVLLICARTKQAVLNQRCWKLCRFHRI